MAFKSLTRTPLEWRAAGRTLAIRHPGSLVPGPVRPVTLFRHLVWLIGVGYQLIQFLSTSRARQSQIALRPKGSGSAVKAVKVLREPIQVTEEWPWTFRLDIGWIGLALRVSTHCLWLWPYQFVSQHKKLCMTLPASYAYLIGKGWVLWNDELWFSAILHLHSLLLTHPPRACLMCANLTISCTRGTVELPNVVWPVDRPDDEPILVSMDRVAKCSMELLCSTERHNPITPPLLCTCAWGNKQAHGMPLGDPLVTSKHIVDLNPGHSWTPGNSILGCMLSDCS